MRLARGGGVFDFCLWASFALFIASRTAIDDPALVVLTAVGVVFGLDVADGIFPTCCKRRGEACGVVGVPARMEEIGVFGRDLDVLNVDAVCTRGLETEKDDCELLGVKVACFVGFVDGGARGVFRADASCRSFARRRVSLVRPARLYEGVCGGIVRAMGGVLGTEVSSLGVPKLSAGGSSARGTEVCEEVFA